MADGRPKTDTIRVLIVDDHPIIRDSLTTAMENVADIEVVGTASTASEVYEGCKKAHPDVLVMDLSLADAHGLDLIQNVRTQHPSIQAVIFSMFKEEAYAERAVRCGAMGYVMKSEPTDKVLAAIRSAHRGEYFLGKKILARILGSLASGSSQRPDFPFADLTDREMHVYQLIGQGLEVSAIARQLNLSRKTVEAYRRRVKEKLELESINALLQHAMRWTQSQSTSE